MTNKTYEAELDAFFKRHRYINEAIVRALIESGDGAALRIYLSNHGIADDPPMPARAAEPAPERPAQAKAPTPPAGMAAWPETRVSSILGLPEAAGRPAAARRLAAAGLSVEAARRELARMPYEPQTARTDTPAAAVGVRPDQSAQPTGKTKAEEAWRKAIASLPPADPFGL